MSTKFNNYESVWIKMQTAICDEAIIEKCNIYFRQSFDICFIIAELDFKTTNEMSGDIVFNIPELNKDFVYCENTILADKIDEDGEFIKTFSSGHEAASEYDVTSSSIYGAIRNNFVSKGFLWRYVEDGVIIPKIDKVTPHRKYMKQVDIYKDDVLFKSFLIL